jgi:hypothetical protein
MNSPLMLVTYALVPAREGQQLPELFATWRSVHERLFDGVRVMSACMMSSSSYGSPLTTKPDDS